jgi:hypothetical protein
MTRPPGTGRYAERALACGLLLLTLAAGCASGGQQPGASLPRCTGVLLIGVRGSGESPALDHGLGATLAGLYRQLAAGRPASQSGAYGLPYAERSTGAAVVIEASTRLAAIIARRHHQCPGEHLILAGYSLGAAILGDALQDPRLATGPPPFTAAILLADPRFNPTDTAAATGTFDPRYHGDQPRPAYPVPLASRIRSYCRKNDPICQSGDPTAQKAEHGRYTPQQTRQAVTFIEQIIARPILEPVTSSV